MYVGDWWQLPPIEKAGASLSNLPESVAPIKLPFGADTKQQRGLDLIWNMSRRWCDEEFPHPLIVLKEQIRCTDPWWNEVLTECRDGRMTKNTHKFLHGDHTTTVPGSWEQGLNGPRCGREACRAAKDTVPESRSAREAYWMKHECRQCAQERERRCRVVEADDPRLREARFKHARCIMANNDIKFHTCKVRAAQFARDTGQSISWCRAVDLVKDMAHLEGKDVVKEKQRWLRLHDRNCGGLYGMLPLIRGMPVCLTGHVDRSEKALLKGRSGILLGWQNDEREPAHARGKDHYLLYAPKVLYVQFNLSESEPQWSLKGFAHQKKHPGVYALARTSEAWYVDSFNAKPNFGVRRSPRVRAWVRVSVLFQDETGPVSVCGLELGLGLGSEL